MSQQTVAASVATGDPHAGGVVKQGIKTKAQELLPHKDQDRK